ncbi:hypothetical protein [Pontibacillus yanchengensis]|uniref:Uncharacterized protein n=1 Tax=Pontibacillus yanchengensis Y32 TaxID=1385514 RepID=A0A0A2TNQ5_9BACI|nr:hypothetical protein [Pontibacillus yanchengensis]KGP70955.1 hypothetical protein N782_02680 [Pontibacillus yanchengensis Y32]
MPDLAIVIMFFVISVLLISFYVQIWIRLLAAAYYGVVLTLFSRGYNQIISKKNKQEERNGLNQDTPGMDQILREKAELINIYTGLLFIPILFFIFYSYYKLFNKIEKRSHKVLIILSIIPVVIVYLLILLFYLMDSYTP